MVDALAIAEGEKRGTYLFIWEEREAVERCQKTCAGRPFMRMDSSCIDGTQKKRGSEFSMAFRAEGSLGIGSLPGSVTIPFCCQKKPTGGFSFRER